MTATLIALAVALALALAALASVLSRRLAWKRTSESARGASRILFPFTAHGLSPTALDAALRLARAEQATLVPVFLARVALRLPLEAPLPRQSAVAVTLQEVIDQRAARFGVAVDHRIERGRTHRHALRRTFANERFDRLVLAAAPAGAAGIGAEDVAWVLRHGPGEILVLRPRLDDALRPQARGRPRKPLAASR